MSDTQRYRKAISGCCTFCNDHNKYERMKKMEINEFAKMVHENAVAHGWLDEPRSGAEIIALCHSELSESLEEMRKGMPKEYVNIGGNVVTETALFGTRKTEGVAVELCDCIIRILDYLVELGVDVESVLMRKHLYNVSRPYKHGKKF